MIVMNPNMVNDVTMIAGAAGYALGAAADQIAVWRAGRNTAVLSDTLNQALGAETARKSNAGRRIGAALVSPLALGVGLAAAMNTYAWTPASEAAQSTPPMLEVVVDHSGATGLDIGGKPVISEIDQVVNQFTNAKGMNVEAIVASSGSLKTVQIDKVAGSIASGPADMPSATSLALSRAAEVPPANDGKKFKANAGVLVITNGNAIGSSKAVARQAEQQYGASKVATPVFIVNVEGDKAGEDVTSELQKIASETGANYWSADKGNLDKVAEDVRSTIEDAEVKSVNGPDKTPIKWLGGLAGLAAVSIFMRRSSMPFGRGVKG